MAQRGDREDREEVEHYDKSHPQEKGYKKKPSFREQIGPALQRFGSDLSTVIEKGKRINAKVQERHRNTEALGRGKGRNRSSSQGKPLGGFGSSIGFEDLMYGGGPSVGAYGIEPHRAPSQFRKRKTRRNSPPREKTSTYADYIKHMNSMPDAWKGMF
jgi:hypothetical protein